MDSIFYWLIDRLIDFLARINPARAKKAEAIKAEADRLEAAANEQEARRKENEVRYAEENAKRIEWDRLVAQAGQQTIESQARFVASQTRLRELEAAAEKAKAKLDSLSEDEKVRLNL